MVAKADHIILCGGAPAPRRAKPDEIVRLDLGGDEPNVDLEIVNISRRLSSDVPDILTDLVEIASYVYCADQAVTRGGGGVLVFGAQWRRNFIFHIPVRKPSTWSSPNVLHVLQKTLGILSEDTYEFHFVQRTKAVPMQHYLPLGEGGDGGDGDSTAQELDEVLLFSGGLDSLGGTVQEAVLGKRKVALVSHRSNSKVYSRQKKLMAGLRTICKVNPPLHVPVWVHQSGTEGREYTQRSRTFLYASLGTAVARVFGLKRIRFYENGVISLNLPISEQVVGARATRTTHPQVLDGFASLFSLLVQETFTVENPFLWMTKTEVVDLIGDAGCGHLIEESVSCTHTREQTLEKPHCGRCSQCISRKFATLASRYSNRDPGSLYHTDLLTDARTPEKDLTLVESFIRTATQIGSMNELQVVEHYGEVGRVLRHLRPLSADQVAERVVQLYRRHSAEVTGVMDGAIRDHASDIREGKLPATCAILLAIPDAYKKVQGTEGREAQPDVPITNVNPPVDLIGRGKGSMDLASQTDPIWTVTSAQKGPIPLTKLNGEIVLLNADGADEPDDAIYTPEDEQHVAGVTLKGRSGLRSEIEALFGGASWPQVSALVEPFRRYATEVFDVNAAAYHRVASTQGRDSHEVLSGMVRALLSDVFGSEWENSPGERVTRTDWQSGSKGWTGREMVVIAGNDADKNCLYHELVGDAVTYRYRFHAVIPAAGPGEPPGINVSNLEWWQYIGLKERHNFAMAIKPYLEDRVSHWQSVFTLAKSSDASGAREVQVNAQAAVGGRISKRPARRNAKYERIDKALRECAEARPKGHEDVFRSLDDRNVPFPARRPFKSAGGWMKGFQHNRQAASVWLSQVWAKLDLPAFARGPKK